jgi:monofunctional biosynthetic peptidoglycan transglycosylase
MTQGKRKARRRRPRIGRIAYWVLAVLVGLPAVLVALYAVVPPPATPLMVIRAFEGEGWRRDWVPLERIAPVLPQAVIAAEDNLFCEHWGFDLKSLREVVEEYREGERVRGASTITMQTAKNLFLWPGRSMIRKGIEAYLTPYLELLLTKQRILELYLNVAEWGPGIYGAEAAARTHFGRSAAELTEQQAALLAAVLPNPRRFSAGQPSDYIRKRATTLRQRIDQLGPLLDCAKSGE